MIFLHGCLQHISFDTTCSKPIRCQCSAAIPDSGGSRVNARLIDHLVLPVADLAVARSRLAELGFTVAPEAFHPFGTANACVFFSDGAYLEPLAIANRRQAAAAAKRGNVFTARDLAFRKARNRQGFSALAVATGDAAADHARFRLRGISAGDILEFSRGVKMPDGSETEASFRLAFAGDEHAPDFFLFSAQRINPLPADRGELERHSNTVTGLSEIVLSAASPDDFAPLLEEVLLAKAGIEAAAVELVASNTRIRVMQDQDLESEFALVPLPNAEGLRGRAIIFKTADLAVTEIILAANDVAFVRREGRVLVQAAPGQGVLFGFEE